MMPLWCHTGAMDLTPHVEQIRGQLAIAAEAGGEDARALAERLTAPLESAVRLTPPAAGAGGGAPRAPAERLPAPLESAARLTLLAALPAPADETPRALAPGSVELRLRGGEPDFVVTAPAPEGPVEPLEPPADAAGA